MSFQREIYQTGSTASAGGYATAFLLKLGERIKIKLG
jgi:hypothetical protein